MRIQRDGQQYDQETDRTCQESTTAETAWAACNKDPKLWPGEVVILLLNKASKHLTNVMEDHAFTQVRDELNFKIYIKIQLIFSLGY